ncbi:MAG: TonB-dependent receptor [Sphingomonadales bacterium]|nr:TonB-dependent receptor [Sphingomonadales bacterium]
MSASKLLASAARFALPFVLAGGLAAPAFAADAPASDAAAADAEPGLTDIVVTAQKRSENLQETPIAISVLSGQGMADRHVTSLLDLGDGAIPSLKVAPFFSRPGALIVNVRGVGVLSDSNQPARDQGVGVYVDGVYMGRAQGLGTALFDVASIEVLKGPQGTLFGRNTEGGAVNIVTVKPSGQFKLNATAGLGNYGSYKAEGHVDLPEFANISLKIDGVLARRNPFVKNPLAGALGFNSYDKRGIHVEALWKPVDSFSADLSYDKSYDATTTLYQQQISAGTGLPAAATGSPAVLANTVAALFTLQPTRASTAAIGMPEQASIGRAQGGRLTLEYKAAADLTLRSITSYREMTQNQYDNGSGATTLQQATVTAGVTPSFLNFQFSRYSLAPTRQNQFSQELQAIGELPRFKYQAGAMYYDERVEDSAQAFNTLQMTDAAGSAYIVRSIDYNAQVIQRASHVKTTSVGVYGQATYTPEIANDIAHLTAGVRWTRDKKDGSLFTVNGAAPILPVNGVNVQAPIALKASWSRVDPMVNLAIDASRDIHLYGKWSTGYRSGGANSRSLSYRKFDPETVSMFEIGAKTAFWNRRARLNLAAYTGTYKNIQLDFSGLYEDVVNGVRVATTRTTTDTVNAPGTGRLKGFEAELTLAPVEGLTLTASYAYNSVKIPDTLNPFPQTGGVFITVPVPIYQVYTPEHAASGAIDYETPIGKGTTKLRLHLDGNFDGGYYANYTDSNYDSVTRAVRYAQPKGDSALVFNGRIALADIAMGASNARLTVAAWARNLFNEQHLFYKSGSAAGGVNGFFNDPRTFGIELNVKM